MGEIKSGMGMLLQSLGIKTEEINKVVVMLPTFISELDARILGIERAQAKITADIQLLLRAQQARLQLTVTELVAGEEHGKRNEYDGGNYTIGIAAGGTDSESSYGDCGVDGNLR